MTGVGQSATPEHVRVGDSFRRKRASWPSRMRACARWFRATCAQQLLTDPASWASNTARPPSGPPLCPEGLPCIVRRCYRKLLFQRIGCAASPGCSRPAQPPQGGDRHRPDDPQRPTRRLFFVSSCPLSSCRPPARRHSRDKGLRNRPTQMNALRQDRNLPCPTQTSAYRKNAPSPDLCGEQFGPAVLPASQSGAS